MKRKKTKQESLKALPWAWTALFLVLAAISGITLHNYNERDGGLGLQVEEKKATYTYDTCVSDGGKLEAPSPRGGSKKCVTSDGRTYMQIPPYEQKAKVFQDCVNKHGYDFDKDHCLDDKRYYHVRPMGTETHSYEECTRHSKVPQLSIYPGVCVDDISGRQFIQDRD